jgi:hypothetical protein
MTVAVETPEGVRTGSSVVEVRSWRGKGFPGPEAAQLSSKVEGDAVTVDLGSRGFLFALLRSANRGSGGEKYAWSLLPNPPTSGSDSNRLRQNFEALKSVKGSVSLPQTDYPLLVRFRDIRRPQTVEKVDPESLDGAFGAGVRLKSIQVQMTDEPVTTGTSKLFPWWAEYLSKHFDGSPTNYENMTNKSPSAHLSSGSFSARHD